MQGAIFDVDGTLLDSMGVWQQITEKYFKENNKPLTYELNTKFQEMTLEESTNLMSNTLNFKETPEEIAHSLKSLVAFEYTHNIPLKPYAKEYLQSLHSNGVKLGIATSGYKELCKVAFIRLGIWDLFDAIALSSEVGVNKSNPDVYLLASNRLQIPPNQCTVYEDIISGVKGAKKAGMKAVGVYESANPDTSLLAKYCDNYIMSFKDLL